MKKNEYLDLDIIKRPTKGKYLGKYVTFKTKYLIKSALQFDSRNDLSKMYGKRFNINFDNCIDILVDGVNGNIHSIRHLIYDLSQGRWVSNLKKYDPLVVKGYVPRNYIRDYTAYACIVQELKRDTKISGTNKYQIAVSEKNKHEPRASRSKYRRKMKELLSEEELPHADLMVDNAKTTYQIIDECLKYGLSLDEIDFLLETHRSLSFNPSIASLRKLFFQLRKDTEMLNDALEVIEENRSFISENIHSGVEGFMRDNHLIYEFSKLLKEHDNSLEKLKMYLESFPWESDGSDEENDDS